MPTCVTTSGSLLPAVPTPYPSAFNGVVTGIHTNSFPVLFPFSSTLSVITKPLFTSGPLSAVQLDSCPTVVTFTGANPAGITGFELL